MCGRGKRKGGRENKLIQKLTNLHRKRKGYKYDLLSLSTHLLNKREHNQPKASTLTEGMHLNCMG